MVGIGKTPAQQSHPNPNNVILSALLVILSALLVILSALIVSSWAQSKDLYSLRCNPAGRSFGSLCSLRM